MRKNKRLTPSPEKKEAPTRKEENNTENRSEKNPISAPQEPPMAPDREEKNGFADARRKETIIKHILLPIVVGIAVVFVGFIGTAAINWKYIIPMMEQHRDEKINEFQSNVIESLEDYQQDYQSEIERLEKEIEDISNRNFNNTEPLNGRIDALNERIDEIYNMLWSLMAPSYMSFQCDEVFAQTLEHSIGTEDGPFVSGLVSFSSATVTDTDGKKYTGADLEGQPLFVSYKEGEKEILFCGQLNDEGLYDGNCLINIYKNGKLILITDATYENGKMLNYKQAYTFSTAGNELVWAISNKLEENKGEVWTYFYQDIDKNFAYEDAKASDVLTIEGFKEIVSASKFMLEGYYFGKTSEGFFNDTSGESYIVKYFKENGAVRTLYYGDFKDGRFYDQTGNAWMIGKIKIDQEFYAYYKGLFENNTYVENGGVWQYNLNDEDIMAILDSYYFNCPLTGLVPTENNTGTDSAEA